MESSSSSSSFLLLPSSLCTPAICKIHKRRLYPVHRNPGYISSAYFRFAPAAVHAAISPPLLRPTTVNFIMYIPVYRGEVPIHPHFSFPPSKKRDREGRRKRERRNREWDVIIRGVGESFWWKLLRGKIFGLSSEDLVRVEGGFWDDGMGYVTVSRYPSRCIFNFLKKYQSMKIARKEEKWKFDYNWHFNILSRYVHRRPSL